MDRGGFEPPPPRFAHGITTTRLSAQNAFPFYLANKFLLKQTMAQLRYVFYDGIISLTRLTSI